MKKTLLLILCGLSLTTLAQKQKESGVAPSGMPPVSISKSINDDNGKLHIQVEKEENGKKIKFDQTYDVAKMNEAQKQALIERVSDSLGVNDKSGKRMKIRIKSNDMDGDHFVMRRGTPPPMPPRMKRDDADLEKEFGYKFDIDMDKGMDHLDKQLKEFNFNFDEPVKIIRRFGNKMPDMMHYFNDGNEAKTVQTLRAYPNNPFNNRLNIKFEAPEKGDVTITITDITGKEIGRDVIKDFSGEYVGQIELKKAEKGTYFVTVVQGKDGSVKRVVVE